MQWRKREERKEDEWTEGESNRCGVCNFALSPCLSLSLCGYAPFDALGDVHTIKQGNTRDKGGSKRTLRLRAQPSRLPRILRETYCLRISIFRATRQTQLFFLSFYSLLFFFLVCFVSFPFPFFVSIFLSSFSPVLFSFFFFFSSNCSARDASSRYPAVGYVSRMSSSSTMSRAVIKNLLTSDTLFLVSFVRRLWRKTAVSSARFSNATYPTCTGIQGRFRADVFIACVSWIVDTAWILFFTVSDTDIEGNWGVKILRIELSVILLSENWGKVIVLYSFIKLQNVYSINWNYLGARFLLDQFPHFIIIISTRRQSSPKRKRKDNSWKSRKEKYRRDGFVIYSVLLGEKFFNFLRLRSTPAAICIQRARYHKKTYRFFFALHHPFRIQLAHPMPEGYSCTGIA